MPFTAVTSTTAALSIAGTPPFACFISEFLIFVGAFEIINVDGFYLWPTAFMLVATVLSLAYSLRFTRTVFLGQPKPPKEGEEKKILDVPNYMKAAMVILVVFVVVLGIWPTFFVDLIKTVSFG
jgi:formate hydrogenlyase subunit 3/multisubunit Na+/H+ antiporter MnhD subunit